MNKELEIIAFTKKHNRLINEVLLQQANDSLLRSNFKVWKLKEIELPIIKIDKKISYYDDKGSSILRIQNKNNLAVPLFEVSSNPEQNYEDIKDLNENQVVDIFTEGQPFKKIEDQMYNSLIKEGDGKGTLLIRTDIVSLCASDLKMHKVGYSYFEQIGVILEHE